MNKTHLNVSNSFYYLLASIYLISFIISSTNAQSFLFIAMPTFLSYIRYMVFIGLVVLFLLKNRTMKIKTLCIIAGMLIVVGVVYSRIDDSMMLITVMFILAYKGCEIDILSQWLYKSVLYMVGIIFLLCLTNLIPDTVIIRTGGGVRHSYGFLGANALSSTIFVGLVFYLYSNRKRLNRSRLGAFILISFVTYLITDSRMAFLLELVLFIMSITLSQSEKLKKIMFLLSKYSFTVFAGLTFLLTQWYALEPNSNIRSVINLFTTGRLYWIYYFQNKYGYSLFGQGIHMVGVKLSQQTGESWKSIDNAYAMLAIHYGVILLVLLGVAYLLLGDYLKIRNNYIGALCVTVLAFWGLTENTIIHICYNIFFYFFAEMLWNKKNIFINEKSKLGEGNILQKT